jgi:hypothetical protein
MLYSSAVQCAVLVAWSGYPSEIIHGWWKQVLSRTSAYSLGVVVQYVGSIDTAKLSVIDTILERVMTESARWCDLPLCCHYKNKR